MNVGYRLFVLDCESKECLEWYLEECDVKTQARPCSSALIPEGEHSLRCEVVRYDLVGSGDREVTVFGRYSSAPAAQPTRGFLGRLAWWLFLKFT